MEVALALLADYANVSREGKLNILGIFDRINVQSVPAIHPQMQLIMTLEADRAEADREHKVEVELTDADGTGLFSIKGSLQFGQPPLGERVGINHVIQLNNLRFDRFGQYAFKILINNELRKSVPLTVIQCTPSHWSRPCEKMAPSTPD
ncbi:MAG: hypothetical protein M1136_02575 [Chloroflexi bacterium]|nr:hypothetical protein [Chloroflexota bacterium]MCL5074524.1 hypothetical protein [Chloroflexota bacterium]